MILHETYELANGVRIPKLGLGTWLLNGGETAKAVGDAVRLGYRHIDTAQAYGNEEGVGAGLKACGVPRAELFVTTKVRAEHKTYAAAAASIDESLQKLGTDDVDLLLIHSPQPWSEFRAEGNRYFAENREVWRALEDAYKAEKARAIGLSNFLRDDVENLLASCEIRPMADQVLCHVGNTPFGLLGFCGQNGILAEAYSPVAHGAILAQQEVCALAGKYGVSAAQLCLRYDLQLGAAVLPKTANPEHMKNNAELDFTIAEADMAALKKIEKLKDYGRDRDFPVFAKG